MGIKLTTRAKKRLKIETLILTIFEFVVNLYAF